MSNINRVFIYSTNNKNKIIGKLSNISKDETLKQIRPKIKKMDINDELVRPTNDNYDIFDKDMEEDFCLEDLLIKENDVYKIFIKESNDKNVNHENRNSINNNLIPLMENMDINMNNNNKYNLNQNTININNNNNINNMNNINNNSHNINNGMNNMNNFNSINQDMVNINNNNNNNNNENNLSTKFNEQMNDDFTKKYNILFKTTNGIDYTITANGRKSINYLISKYESEILGNIISNLLYKYNGQEFKFFYNITINISHFFNKDRYPTIIVNNDKNEIGKLITITFKINNEDKYEIIFNSMANISLIKIKFEEKFFVYQSIKYCNNENFEFLYKGDKIKFDNNNITIGSFLKNDDNPIIMVNDLNKLIDKKIKVKFETNHGYKNEIIIYDKAPINNLLKLYLIEIMGDIEFDIFLSNKIYKIINEINFIYKEQQIKYKRDDMQDPNYINELNNNTICDFFKNDSNPIIFVNDLNNLLLINWNAQRNITFKTNHGDINQLILDNFEDPNEMVEKYFKLINQEKLYQRNMILFIFNNNQIKYEPQKDEKQKEAYIPIGQIFQNEPNPIVFVNDINNLFLINWKQRKNITFKVNQSYKKEISFNNNDSLAYILKQFLIEIYQPELENNDEIKYIYNSKQIVINDWKPFLSRKSSFEQTQIQEYEVYITVGEYFFNDNNPVINVIDPNYLIKPIDIIFQTGQGIKLKMTIFEKRTTEYLLMEYLDKIEHSELIDKNDEIVFLYKGKQIMFGDKTIVKELFLNDNNPTIIVMDVNNVLSNNDIKKINVIFYNEEMGIRKNVIVNYGTTVEQLIKKFCCKYYNLNLETMRFYYNSGIIDYRKKSYVEKFFRGSGIILIDYYLI